MVAGSSMPYLSFTAFRISTAPIESRPASISGVAVLISEPSNPAHAEVVPASKACPICEAGMQQAALRLPTVRNEGNCLYGAVMSQSRSGAYLTQCQPAHVQSDGRVLP